MIKYKITYQQKTVEFLTLSEAESFISANNIIAEIEQIDEEIPNEKRLKVLDLVHPLYQRLEPSKIDFTIHLQNNVLLMKKVEMLANGRPTVAKYYYPSVSPENLICSIDFEFTDNAMKFMTERKEWLKYYNTDGSFEGPFLIHQRQYDFANLKEATESIQERSQARRNIIDEIKVFLNGFIVQKSMLEGQTPSQANVTAMVLGGGFMQSHQTKINAWIETAAGDLKPYLLNLNSDQQEPLLDWYVQAGVRVRDYFLSRISY